MLGAILSLGVLGLDWAYHYLTKPPPSKLGGTAIQIPRTDLGGPVPIVFGWTKVKAPFLAYADAPLAMPTIDTGTGNVLFATYSMNLAFVVGIPMGAGHTHGDRLNSSAPKLWRVWYGDKLLPSPGLPAVGPSDGSYVTQGNMLGGPGGGGGLYGAYYWFGGWTDQRFDFPATPVGDAMAARALATRADADLFGGLPNQMVIGFTAHKDAYSSITAADPGSTGFLESIPSEGFCFGESPNVSAISCEVSTYGDVVSGVTQHIFSMNAPGVDFGGDADPAEVIYCICIDVFGKLGLDPSLIDLVSFGAASATLKAEGHGYSRAFEEGQTAAEMIQDVVRQIDGVLGFSSSTGKLTLKLIRPDYNPPDLPVIDKTNCDALTNLVITGPSDLPNKVKILYPNRLKAYAMVPATSQNMANGVGQDGISIETVLTFEGITNETVAQAVADRELAWASRSSIKCTAICDRSLLSQLSLGDPVMVRWTGPDISGLVFRVVNINSGTLADAKVSIDLIQDASYVWRNRPPVDTGFGGHDASGLSGLTSG